METARWIGFRRDSLFWAVLNLLTLLLVLPALILVPCHGFEILLTLPSEVGSSISGSLLPDRSDQRREAGESGEDTEIKWAPVTTSWAWSELDPAWQPMGEPARPESFMAFWETSASVFPSQVVSPLMPVLLQAEDDAVPADGAPADGAPGDGPPPAEVGPELAPDAEGGEAWVPEEGADAEAAEVQAEGPEVRDRLLVEQEVGECSIKGEVYDQATFDPIEGAVVTIAGTGREDMTDAEGRFEVGGLPGRDFTVNVLKIGYSVKEVSASPRPGTPAEVRVGLAVKASDAGDGVFELPEETVIGEYVEENQGDFNLDITSSLSLSSGLGQEDFAKENVSDAGEAVGKVSGANIVGGKFAVVRGLADRYVGTTFNGGQVSSAVSDRKAIELDLFPTSAIQAIDVAKTYTPSLLGDFGGASIDIKSRFFPKEPLAFIKIKGKYNPDLPDNFLTMPGKDLGFLGSTSNHLNTSEFTRTNPATGQVRLVTSPPDAALDTWSRLNNTRLSYPQLGDSSEELSYGLGFGDTFEVTDYLDLGLLVGHGWKSGSDYNRSSERRVSGRTWEQEYFRDFTEWDLYLAGSARLNDDHEVRAVYFRKHIGQNNVKTGSDIRDPNGDFGLGDPGIQNLQGTRPYYGADAELLGGFFELEPLERDLTILQLTGESRLGERGPRIRWGYTDSEAEESRPNTTFQEFTTLDFTSSALEDARIEGEEFITSFAEEALGLPPGSLTYEEAQQEFIDAGAEGLLNVLQEQRIPVQDPSLGKIDTLAISQFANSVGAGNILTRAVQSVEEFTTDGNLAVDMPWYFSDDNEDNGFELGFGGAQISRERRNRGSLYELVYEETNASGNTVGGFNEDDFYPSDDENGNGFTNLAEELLGDTFGIGSFFTGQNATGPYYQDGSTGTDNFAGLLANNANSTHDIQGAFVSGNLFLDNFFIRGGLRYEDEERRAQFVEPKPVGEEDPAPISEKVWLPSVTAGTTIFDDRLNLLVAWSNTVARPTFFEWVPTRSFDLSTGFIRRGNPDLINSDITNFDLAAEFKANEQQTYRVSFFHKNITDPIVAVRVPGVANAISYINGNEGLISGAEFEMELSDLGPFSLKTNLTYIDATLEYAFNTGEPVSVGFPFQPNWIMNLNLGYENEDWDFGVNLIYNFTGEYATLLRTTPDAPDVVQESQHTLDLVVRKGFELENGTRLAITAGIENLIGTDQVFRFADSDGNLGATRSTIERDRLYFAELKYEF